MVPGEDRIGTRKKAVKATEGTSGTSCRTVLRNPGRTKVTEHKIRTGDAVPIRHRPYRMAESQREVAREEIDRMLEMGIIRPSKSEWASPALLVPKKDRSKRFCADYRALNRIAKFDAYPMPRIDEIIDRLGGARYISTLDLTRGYWQVPLAEDSIEKSAFTTPFGLFEFLVMPFGLHGAPATFQRMMDNILRGAEKFAAAYLDDVVIYSETWEDHLLHLEEVINRLKFHGLTAKPKKGALATKEVPFLGYVVGGGRVRPTDERSRLHRNTCLRRRRRK